MGRHRHLAGPAVPPAAWRTVAEICLGGNVFFRVHGLLSPKSQASVQPPVNTCVRLDQMSGTGAVGCGEERGRSRN